MTAMVTFLILTYLLAAVPFGVVITTIYGGDVDLRAAGSGNIGATNVARVYGWRIAGPVLALDVLKGFLPVMAARCMWPESGVVWLGIVGIVAFCGHCWPVYLEFRGGKGVATGAGALLGLTPVPTLLAAGLWGGLLAGTGRSSVAALGATLGMIAVTAWWDPHLAPVVALFALGVAGRHVANIRRLVRGEEKEVVRPVRWARRGAEPLTAEEALSQDPSGRPANPAGWKESVEDPLD